MSKIDTPEGIAVVGMAGRFPAASSVDELWTNLATGRDGFRQFSVDELVAAGLPRQIAEMPNLVRRCPVVDHPTAFEPHAFGYSPAEAELIDPQHRMLMQCAWQALEHAGYDPHRFDGSIGIWVGCGFAEYALKHLLTMFGPFGELSLLNVSGAPERDSVTARIARNFDLRGPAVLVQTACSTSLVATHLACQALLTYQCDLALAGGVSLQYTRVPGYLYAEGEIFSPDGFCRAFDHQASGTVLGEGCGVVALRRLGDALAAGDTVLAVIRGSAVNNDGASRAGYTAPGVAGQAELIGVALGVAGVRADEISYIEAHGTGTALGDPIEVAALTKAFRQSTNEQGYCGLGSVKANIGHLDTAAGITGLIKTVCALQHRQLPPTPHFVEPNPELNLATSPFYVVDRLVEWRPRNGRRLAGVSSFGLGGTNAHVVVEEFSATIRRAPSHQRWRWVPVSAATESALKSSRDNLAAYLKAPGTGCDLADVAFTLTVGRQRLSHRLGAVADSLQDAARRLEKPDELYAAQGRADLAERPVVFLFSGQGTQYPGMAEGLLHTQPVFRESLERCAQIIGAIGGHDSLLDILYGGHPGSETVLSQTAVSQPALFALEYSLARLWEASGVKPVAVAGHSIGEYVAACEAGVFSLEDALALVQERGRLMQSMPPGAMLAVLRPEGEVRELLPPGLDLAAINGPALCVVSGSTGEVEAFAQALKERGVNWQRLHTSHAFHSRMTEVITDALSQAVSATSRSAPRLALASNLSGTWASEEDAVDPSYWARHMRNTVRFGDNLLAVARRFPSALLLEVGPGNTLCSIARQQPDEVKALATVASVRHPRQQVADDVFFLRAAGALWCHGVTIDLAALAPAEQRRRLPLPGYPFEQEWLLSRQGP
jgi:acyl transferase domain-containing protein